ncbi:MAG: hypothetical protein KJN93_01925, partial [Alphaproteobacteria bacterium]|nr:hypothetical protein [Alphaproteobacteria bacterium]
LEIDGAEETGAAENGAKKDGAEKDGAAEVVDWLVRMRRLPAELMLDTIIAKGRARQATAAGVIGVLAPFYAGSERPRTYPATRIARFADQFREDAAVLLDPSFALDGARVSALCDRCDRDLVDLTLVLRAQASKRLLVDGHGDLRPEHICLCRPPVIFDCIDFDPELRIVDPFEEIAFLGMECARLGAPWMLGPLYKGLSSALDVSPDPRLMAFYWRARCMLRARLALAHHYDRDPRTPQKWRPLALRYLDLAEAAEQVTAPLAGPDLQPAAGSRRQTPTRR